MEISTLVERWKANMSATTVIVISIIITLLVLWASVWVVVKGYAYKHTIDTDDTINNNQEANLNQNDNNKA